MQASCREILLHCVKPNCISTSLVYSHRSYQHACVYGQALEHRSLKLAEMLQQTYSVSLAREPQLASLLQRVKEIYLGAQSSGGMQEMMSNMMQMLSG